MKRKSIILLVTLAAIISLVLAGCAPQAAPPEEAPPKEAAPVIELTMACHVTPTYHDLFPRCQNFVDDVNELGAGKVKIDFYHSETLLGVKELCPGLEAGTVELIFHTSTHTTGSWPIMSGQSLPFLFASPADSQSRLEIDSPLYEFINKELREKHDVILLANGALPLFHIWTAKKVVRTPEDLAGMIIRVTGKPDGLAIEGCGGSSVFMPSAELYEAFQRGTIDGVVTYPGTIGGRSLEEVLKYCCRVPFAAWGYGIYVKASTWDTWPQEIRDIITMAAIKYDYRHLAWSTRVEEQEYWGKFEDAGMEVIEPSPEALSAFKEKTRSAWDAWAEEMGTETANKFLEIATK